LSPSAVEYLIKKYSTRTGLENVTPHVLRHTFCKSLVDAGESLDRVATLAVHENLHYSQIYKGDGERFSKCRGEVGLGIEFFCACNKINFSNQGLCILYHLGACYLLLQDV
jgi:hypothetical protein